MTASTSDQTPALSFHARMAFRISMVALVVCTAYAIYLFMQATQIGTVERYRAAIMMAGLAITAAVSAWLSRRGQSTLGIVLLLGWLYLTVLEAPTRQNGQGLLLGVIAVLVTIIVASQTLDRTWSQWMIVVSIIVALLATLLDATGPADRPYYGLTGPMIVATICVASFIVLIARQFQTYPLRTKLIVAFLTVSLVSVAAMAFYAERTIRLALQDQVSAQLTNIAQSQGTAIGNLLTKEADLLRALSLDQAIRDQAITANAGYQGTASDIQNAILALDQQWIAAADANDDANPLIQSKINNAVADHLREYRQTYPENVEIFVTDRYGALLGATNPTSDYYQADEEWWQATYNNGQGAVYYSQPAYDTSSQSFSIDIGIPLYDRVTQELVGVLRTTFDMETVVTLLGAVQSGQTGNIELLLPDGTYLQAGGAQPAPENVVTGVPVNSATAIEINLEGIPSLVASVPVHTAEAALADTISQLGWRVVAHQSSAEILAPVEAQAGTLLLVMGLVAVIATLTSVFMSQVLVRPIARLTTVAEKVAEGDLNTRAVVETQDEIGLLATTFNSMTEQLRSVVTSLEQRVEARTAQLRTSAEVGRAAASILDTEQLLRDVVNLITDRFGFYYTAIFLTDETGEWAVLHAASGEAGQILKERGHRLFINGQSMVGTAMRSRHPRIALDVGDEAVRFANPLLPETRSEVALPLIVGQQLLGALDVQSTQVAAFDEASAAVLQIMADQIAIALSNTQQFQQTQIALSSERRQNEVSLAISQAEDAASLLYALVAYATDEADAAAILLYGPRDPFGRLLYIEVSAGWSRFAEESPLVTGARFTPDQLPYLEAVGPGQPLTISDISDAVVKPEYQKALASWKARALMAVDLAVGDKTLGTLIFAFNQPRFFSETELDAWQAYARQTAVVLRNRQLVSESQAALRQIDDINRRLTGEAWDAYRVAVGQPLSQVNWRQGLPEETDNGRISTAAAPVIVNGVEIGMLRLEDPNPDREWPSEDLSLLEAVASEVSIAVEKNRLVEETERRAQREQTINRITGHIRNASSIDDMLAIAAQELRLEMQATRTIAEIKPEIQPADNRQPQGKRS